MGRERDELQNLLVIQNDFSWGLVTIQNPIPYLKNTFEILKIHREFKSPWECIHIRIILLPHSVVIIFNLK